MAYAGPKAGQTPEKQKKALKPAACSRYKQGE